MKIHIFHEWSNWEKIGEGQLVHKCGFVFERYIIQERKCVVCGYVQRKRTAY